MPVDLITILPFSGLGFLVWDCIEVGRNDAANIVNAVFGARILRRRMAVAVAGLFVLLGATLSTPVMETARQGIFEPAAMTLRTALIAYISVYLVDTVLLYTYSAFGMPVSTTACLVFELLGASLGLAGAAVIHWANVGSVVAAIFVSIVMAGLGGFFDPAGVSGGHPRPDRRSGNHSVAWALYMWADADLARLVHDHQRDGQHCLGAVVSAELYRPLHADLGLFSGLGG